MAESKLREELEEQDFSSFYRMDVYRLNDQYAIILILSEKLDPIVNQKNQVIKLSFYKNNRKFAVGIYVR